MKPTYYTPNEKWMPPREADHIYTRAITLARQHLAPPGPVLVIGSTVAEVVTLRDEGYAVTFLDIRPAPVVRGVVTRQGNALALPFPDASFSRISSTCVLCHVGIGRYGDPIMEDGDVQMLAEIARVLTPGGRAVLVCGPVADEAFLPSDGRHRVTSNERMARICPLDLVDTLVIDQVDGPYLWVKVVKP